ncbi:Acg family FMN-binding oxidoreductase [Dactylosporangium sp. NPDC000521]|uniref:Acg family FMN-binding oxidoreductase n=1 Tax=Dactylosporangium sp. NPDC000521 TaxID=3363975 RepID=UPI003675E63A
MTDVDIWSEATFMAAVGEAVWAPSIHNSQPWRFRRTADGIDVLIDRARALPVCDPDLRAARVSCGAAVFNLRLALAVAGSPAAWTVGSGDVVAHLVPDRGRRVTPAECRLHRQIRRRHTNRSGFAEARVAPGVMTQLVGEAADEGGWLHVVDDEPAMWTVAQLTRQADTQLKANPAYVAELRAWTSADDEGVQGVGRSARGDAPHPAELMTRRDFGGPSRDVTRDLTLAPVVAVLGYQGEHRMHEIQAGMVLQRVLLRAADLGLATAMYSQPIEVPAIREQLRLALRRPYAPQLVLRFGYAPTTCYTNRRPVADVIDR